MAWRSVVISNPASLSLQHKSLIVDQDNNKVSVPLEDVSVLVIDQPHVRISSSLLTACAENQIATIFVGFNHVPVGTLMPYLPHSRTLKVLREQMLLSLPRKKRIWQQIIRRKILNQAQVLSHGGHFKEAAQLCKYSSNVQSGDSGYRESLAAQIYFPALFGKGFTRDKDIFFNAALNYGYSIIRSAIARSLVGYGFVTALGINHRSEQNQFNLADDLFEPFRPLVDDFVVSEFSDALQTNLEPQIKAQLVNILNTDVVFSLDEKISSRRTVLAATEAIVVGYSQILSEKRNTLEMPIIVSNSAKSVDLEIEDFE